MRTEENFAVLHFRLQLPVKFSNRNGFIVIEIFFFAFVKTLRSSLLHFLQLRMVSLLTTDITSFTFYFCFFFFCLTMIGGLLSMLHWVFLHSLLLGYSLFIYASAKVGFDKFNDHLYNLLDFSYFPCVVKRKPDIPCGGVFLLHQVYNYFPYCIILGVQVGGSRVTVKRFCNDCRQGFKSKHATCVRCKPHLSQVQFYSCTRIVCLLWLIEASYANDFNQSENLENTWPF